MECLVCGSDEIEFLTDGGTKFTVEKSNICLNCGLIFIHPIMDNVDDYYLSDGFSNDFMGESEPSENKREANKERAKVRWDAISGSINTSGRLLEIGCSSGEFLNIAGETHQTVFGIDPSTGFALSVRRKSLFEIYVGLFPDDLPDYLEQFDTIVSFHTLEHVVDPRLFLQEIWNHLATDGVFVIEYPDVSRASLRTTFTSNYFQKSHLFDFSIINIAPLLAEIGFEVEFFATYDGYPRDKNVLFVCKKVAPTTGVGYNRTGAGELHERIKIKLQGINVLPNSPLTILHIASHRINIGDGAISAGIRETIRRIYPGDTRYINFDIVDYGYFGTEIMAESLDGLDPDLILVGGGGTIDGHKTRTQNGTAFTMSIEEIGKLKTPIAFVGLGHNLFAHQEFYHADILNRFIDFCYMRDIPFSVRDDGSFERLEKLSGNDWGEEITVIPDPGFFVPVLDDLPSPMFPTGGNKKVVIQIALDAYAHRFGGESVDHKQNTNDFMDKMAQYIVHLVSEYDASIALATHTMDDLEAALILLRRLERGKARLHIKQTGVYHPVYAPMFFRTYADADLVVGMRGHSVICAAGLGTPVIPISTHNKIAGFSDKAGLRPWTLHPPLDDSVLHSLTDTLLGEDGENQARLVKEKTADWYNRLSVYLTRCLNAV